MKLNRTFKEKYNFEINIARKRDYLCKEQKGDEERSDGQRHREAEKISLNYNTNGQCCCITIITKLCT